MDKQENATSKWTYNFEENIRTNGMKWQVKTLHEMSSFPLVSFSQALQDILRLQPSAEYYSSYGMSIILSWWEDVTEDDKRVKDYLFYENRKVALQKKNEEDMIETLRKSRPELFK